jgi:hypothetical protein
MTSRDLKQHKSVAPDLIPCEAEEISQFAGCIIGTFR